MTTKVPISEVKTDFFVNGKAVKVEPGWSIRIPFARLLEVWNGGPPRDDRGQTPSGTVRQG